MTATTKRRNQPRLRTARGKRLTREPIAALAHPDIRRAVERDSIRWNCSYSWVISTALAAFYGVDIIRPNEAKRRKAGAKHGR